MFRRIAYGSNLGNFWHVVQQIGKTIVQSCQRMIFLPTKSFHDKPNVTVNRRIYRCSRGRLGLAVKKGKCHLQPVSNTHHRAREPEAARVGSSVSAEIGVTMTGRSRRREDADLIRQFAVRRVPLSSESRERADRSASNSETPLSRREIEARVTAFLVEAGAVARVNDAGRDHGQIRAFQNRTYDIEQSVPTVVMRNEDYGRIVRLITYGSGPVELELDIVNWTHPEGRTVYNAIAELPGTCLLYTSPSPRDRG